MTVRSSIGAAARWVDSRWSADSKPPAETFAQGQQALMIKLLVRSSIVATTIVLVGVGILIWGGWSPEHERLVIYIMAGVIGIYALSNLAVTFGFLVGGPVGRIDLEATRSGFKAGVSDKDSKHDLKIEHEKTTVTETSPPPATGSDNEGG